MRRHVPIRGVDCSDPKRGSLRENKTVRGMRPQSRQYLHKWGGVVTEL